MNDDTTLLAVTNALLQEINDHLRRIETLLEQQGLMLRGININNFTQGAQAGQVIAGTDGKQEQKGES